MTESKLSNWPLFVVLCLIWGSSFILMKEGMKTLSPYQVASLRMLTAGLVLFPAGIRKLRIFPLRIQALMLASGLVGSFIPAYLFCIAETRIDSALAGFLNALTPLLTIIIGILFFHKKFHRSRWLGVIIGLCGMLILFLGRQQAGSHYLLYSLLVVLATLLYAFNLNLVGRYLHEVGSVTIVSVAFIYLIPPSLVVLLISGYFKLPLHQPAFLLSTGASTLLGVLGTAVGTILYYRLLKSAGPVFASLVTYGMPFVALFWGLMAGESVSVAELAGLAVILGGVYLANK